MRVVCFAYYICAVKYDSVSCEAVVFFKEIYVVLRQGFQAYVYKHFLALGYVVFGCGAGYHCAWVFVQYVYNFVNYVHLLPLPWACRL